MGAWKDGQKKLVGMGNYSDARLRVSYCPGKEPPETLNCHPTLGRMTLPRKAGKTTARDTVVHIRKHFCVFIS